MKNRKNKKNKCIYSPEENTCSLLVFPFPTAGSLCRGRVVGHTIEGQIPSVDGFFALGLVGSIDDEEVLGGRVHGAAHGLSLLHI